MFVHKKCEHLTETCTTLSTNCILQYTVGMTVMLYMYIGAVLVGIAQYKMKWDPDDASADAAKSYTHTLSPKNNNNNKSNNS